MQSMYTESLRAFLKPVLAYLDDASVSEIMINGPEDVWIERKGRLHKTDAKFSTEGLEGAARNMAQFVGRLLNEERPRLDARLPDGSRIHVVMPPIARKGTTISIRKFFKEKLNVDGLLAYGSIIKPMARLIEAAIITKQNMVVSGGTGSGKTTLLNILSSLIPDDERILTIEDSAELQLNQTHLVPFESRPPDKFGKGGVDMGDLLHSALRLRPDRIVVGEVRGGECFHLMQAMNTGHGGSLSTVHANTPTDTLRRLEALCLMSAVELPMVAVRAQVASAINLIVCCERLYDGSRKTTHISEVLPLNDKGEYRTQDLFVFTPVTKNEEGGILGYFAPTGILPNFVAKARAYGFSDLTDTFFDPATYGVPPPPLYHLGADYQMRWAPSLKHREKGLPDPDGKAAWAALEKRLKDESRASAGKAPAKAAPPPPAAKSAPPRVAPVSAPRPAPTPPRPQPRRAEPVLSDEDKTPPPTENPLEAEQDGESVPVADEPLVQVSSELLDEVAPAGEATPPPRRAPSPPSSRPPTSAARGVPPRRPAREPAPEADDPDKTNVRQMPDRPPPHR